MFHKVFFLGTIIILVSHVSPLSSIFFCRSPFLASSLPSSPISTIPQESATDNQPSQELDTINNPGIASPGGRLPFAIFMILTALSLSLVLFQTYLKRHSREVVPARKNGIKIPGDEDISDSKAGDISEKDKAMILNNVSDVVVFLSPDNQVKWANSHFFKTFSKTPGEVTGRQFHEVVPIAPEKISVFDLDKHRRAGTLHREYFIPEGQRVFKASVSPVFNDLKQFEGFVKTMTDITLQKHIENLLVEAKEKAELADSLKSAFLANMSHEIRTPMNAIIGFAELLELDDLSNRERKEYLRIIRSNGQHLLMLISDILVFSQIETGQLQITRASTKVKPLLEEIAGQFKEEVRKRSNGKVRLRMVADFEHGDEIYTDVLRLRQILYNLMTNAIKFTHQGVITIGCKSGSSHFIFFVKDTGIGIPAEKKQVVFKRFHQVAHAGHDKQQGSGLGLSICRELVYLMGGRIWVNSKEGVGSTFIFKLPT